jgi:hypothetical protein
MFEYEGLPPPCCPDCQLYRDEQFYIVRTLVREYPGITALEVNKITDVPVDAILKFIDAGMLEVVQSVNQDGRLDERLGILLRKAREIKKPTLAQPENPAKMEELKATENKQKFTWLEGSD